MTNIVTSYLASNFQTFCPARKTFFFVLLAERSGSLSPPHSFSICSCSYLDLLACIKSLVCSHTFASAWVLPQWCASLDYGVQITHGRIHALETQHILFFMPWILISSGNWRLKLWYNPRFQGSKRPILHDERSSHSICTAHCFWSQHLSMVSKT